MLADQVSRRFLHGVQIQRLLAGRHIFSFEYVKRRIGGQAVYVYFLRGVQPAVESLGDLLYFDNSDVFRADTGSGSSGFSSCRSLGQMYIGNLAESVDSGVCPAGAVRSRPGVLPDG